MKWSVNALLMLLLYAPSATAQDPQFSQFYANPLYHNPAFAGDNGESRAVLNYRSQWPALGANYRTFSASVDTYLPSASDRLGLGIGLQVMHDEQGDFLTTNSVALQGALDTPLMQQNNGLQIRLIGAGQVSYALGTVNPGGLTFVDQFASGTFRPISLDPLAQVGVPVNQLQLGAGTLVQIQLPNNRPSFWIGGTLHNIGRSRERGDWTGQRLGIQAGISFPLIGQIGGGHGLGNEMERPQSTIGLTAYYRKQDANQQLDVGINWVYEPVSLGVWYRGIPLRTFNKNSQTDAVVLILGLKPDRLPIWFQYSYDITVSSLSWATGGSHELTLWYNFDGLFSLSSERYRNARRQRQCNHF